MPHYQHPFVLAWAFGVLTDMIPDLMSDIFRLRFGMKGLPKPISQAEAYNMLFDKENERLAVKQKTAPSTSSV